MSEQLAIIAMGIFISWYITRDLSRAVIVRVRRYWSRHQIQRQRHMQPEMATARPSPVWQIPMEELKPWETQLVGQWLYINGKMEGNDDEQRIHYVLRYAPRPLQRTAVREGGWTILYTDPNDGRYWELTYPHAYMHGAGPMQLTWLDADEVERLYGI